MKKIAQRLIWILAGFSFFLLPSCERKNRVLFSGSIVGQKNDTLKDVEIEINGTVVRDKDGIFEVGVDSAGKYVVNVRKVGYGLVSKVFYSSVKDKVYRLTKSTVKSFDPSQPIFLQDVGASNRPVPEIQQVDWDSNPFYATPRVLDKNGQLIDFGFTSPALQNAFETLTTASVSNPGMSIAIPANSIVGPDRKPPSGPVMVSVTTVDLYSEDGMPGDNSFVNEGNNTSGFMISMGAGTIELYSEDGKTRYELDGKAKAHLSIPVDPFQTLLSKRIPDTLALLLYNEKKGIWESNGVATLNGERSYYEADVSHFSAYNMDIEKATPSCVRFRHPGDFNNGNSNEYKASSFNYTGNLVPPFTWNVSDPGDCLPEGTGEAERGLHMLYNLPSTADLGPDFNELCVLFYTLGGDPLGIYLLTPNDPYAVRPDCDYDACADLDARKFDALLLAGKFDSAGGGATIRWILNSSGGFEITYVLSKYSDEAATAQIDCDTDSTNGMDCFSIAVAAGDDPKIPSDVKKSVITGVNTGEFLRLAAQGIPGGNVYSNTITK